MANVIKNECEDLYDLSVYELSARGPLLGFLNRNCKRLTTSEFYPETTSGKFKNGVLCQDVQNLTFDSNTFDLTTSTDVFEHVANDILGLENIYRVLKPKGKLIFTVPLWGEETVQRAKVNNSGGIEHILAPEYHGDPITQSGTILAYRNYGFDIVKLVVSIGFSNCKIVSPEASDFWGIRRSVIVAQK